MLHIWRGMATEDGARKGDREREGRKSERVYQSTMFFFSQLSRATTATKLEAIGKTCRRLSFSSAASGQTTTRAPTRIALE